MYIEVQGTGNQQGMDWLCFDRILSLLIAKLHFFPVMVTQHLCAFEPYKPPYPEFYKGL
jgi:hypothetical protein